MDAQTDYGELTIRLPLPPVSQQANAGAKAAFREAVQKVTSTYDFFLSGDVSVSVEWTVSLQVRYETDRSPDVDNILKPLIDALAGPQGVMIDDNQVHHVSCHWVDSYSGDELITITLRFMPGDILKKDGLFFVQLASGLCLPLSTSLPPEVQKTFVERYSSAVRLRNQMMKQGIGYYDASLYMPIQRIFHRSRLAAFKVISEADFHAGRPGASI